MIDQIVKTLCVPGSWPFFVLAFATSSVLIGARGAVRRLGQTSMVLLVLLYVALSLPWVAERLAATVASGRQRPATEDVLASAAHAIVVFSGDHPAGRIDEAVRLYRHTQPRSVIVSGWPALSESLIAHGIPRERILWDSIPLTTHEQALRLPSLLRAHAINDFVLIASSIHMPRALAAVEAAGLHPVPVESAVAMPWVSAGDARFLPHRAALQLNYEVLYEYLAFARYRSRRWLAGR